MIQADWAKIGVKANIVTYEWGEYIKRAQAGEHDAMLIGWTGDNGDPDNWLGTLLGCDAVNGSNFSKWCYKPFDDLLAKARLDHRPERAHEALRRSAGGLQGPGAVHADRACQQRTSRSRSACTVI